MDTSHLDVFKTQQVIAGHLAHEAWLEWLKSLVDVSQCLIDVGCLLIFLVLLDALFDEDLFERTEHQVFEQFATSHLEFLTKQ